MYNMRTVPLLVYSLKVIKDFYKSRSKVKVTKSNIEAWLGKL